MIHYQSPFTLNAIKIRIILTRNDVLTRDFDIYCECVRGCDISACAAGNKRIGSKSARRKTDWLVTDPVMREIGRFRSLAGQSVHLYSVE